MGKVPVTVTVITKNEEKNIDECLSSVHGWADEIIVVDDESSDKTLERARRYTDRVFARKMDNEGIHRNWAHAQARNTWVMILDADEQATEELKREITGALTGTPHSCFSIPVKTYIGKTWIQHSGWYPASKIRLFRNEHFKYEEVGVHPRAILAPGKTEGHLTKDIIHKGYPDIEHFLASVNRQTTLEAQKWIATNRKMPLGTALWRMIDRFPRRYIRKKGYKDGMYGFLIAYFDSFYQLMSYLKYLEMKRNGIKS